MFTLSKPSQLLWHLRDEKVMNEQRSYTLVLKSWLVQLYQFKNMTRQAHKKGATWGKKKQTNVLYLKIRWEVWISDVPLNNTLNHKLLVVHVLDNSQFRSEIDTVVMMMMTVLSSNTSIWKVPIVDKHSVVHVVVGKTTSFRYCTSSC